MIFDQPRLDAAVTNNFLNIDELLFFELDLLDTLRLTRRTRILCMPIKGKQRSHEHHPEKEGQIKSLKKTGFGHMNYRHRKYLLLGCGCCILARLVGGRRI